MYTDDLPDHGSLPPSVAVGRMPTAFNQCNVQERSTTGTRSLMETALSRRPMARTDIKVRIPQ